jgi:sugar phosphate permease
MQVTAPVTPQQDLLPRLQTRVFLLTWLSYATYYLTRKNFAVVKGRLHRTLGVSDASLAAIDTAYLLAYALGQFGSGLLGDRLGPRRMIAVGMLASAATAVVFGMSDVVLLFALAIGANGFFQATGWPNNVKAMQPWFPKKSRGKVMGIWATNYQVGGLCATALATYLLTHHGWRAAFLAPALLVALCGGAVYLLLVERPQDRGLPPLEEGDGEAPPPARDQAPPERGAAATGLAALLRMPTVWALGGAYFGLKLVRYTLLSWLPYYYHDFLHYDEALAGNLSISFEAGGIVGAVAIGWLSDRAFPGRRLRLAAPTILLLAGALALYRQVGHTSVALNGLSMALVGFLLFGPDTLISGAAAQDIGGSRATGSVAGVINGMGSLGAVLQAPLTMLLKHLWGWTAVFSAFVVIALLSGGALLALAWHQGRPRPGPA